jgi:hypothetical protein
MRAWDELREQRDRLLAAQKAKRIDRMHLVHGVVSDKRCGDCVHLYQHRGDYAGAFYKCHQYGYSNGAGTDWRLFWTACGLFADREQAS